MAEKRYKVFDTVTGQFRLGGSSWNGLTGRFSQKGKLWTRISHIKNHLTNCMKFARWFGHNPFVPNIEQIKNQVVVEYELVEVRRFPLADLLKK